MEFVDRENDFAAWRNEARSFLQRGIPPGDIVWEKDDLFGRAPQSADGASAACEKCTVPAEFLELARSVACHRSASRWPLLYRILWRLVRGGERHLLKIASDADIAEAALMAKAVRREIHKMHAFVRFQLISTDPQSGREYFGAWFEPEHFIVEAAAPFFQQRFANMDWSIFTPRGCAHWNGKKLVFTPGLDGKPVKNSDPLEDAWRTYYRSIFNPARLKVKMMKQEMPVRYWKNLPEAGLIGELIHSSHSRVEAMYGEEPRMVKPARPNAYLEKLRKLSSSKEEM